KEGIKVKAGYDFDSNCRFPYEKNNPVPFFREDIRNIKPKDIRPLLHPEKYSILIGCAPCQTFSKHTQKNRNRHKDEKWSLLSVFGRLAKSLKPDFISMENVPELQDKNVFLDFVKLLEQSGYYVSYEVVFCSDYGIIQSRKRLV